MNILRDQLRGARVLDIYAGSGALGLEARQNRQLGFELRFLYRIVGLGNDPTDSTQGGLDQFGFLDGF